MQASCPSPALTLVRRCGGRRTTSLSAAGADLAQIETGECLGGLSKTLLALSLREVKAKYYRSKTSELKGDRRALFQLPNGAMQRGSVTKLPQHDSPEDLAEMFGRFFHEKVSTLRASLSPRDQEQGLSERLARSTSFDHFRPASSDEIRALISSLSDMQTYWRLPSLVL